MPRGGRRTGTQGRSYQNRTDLNVNRGPVPMQAATGQQYGKATAQIAAQRALPVAPPAPPNTAPPAGGPAPPRRPIPGQLPGQVVPLDAPTMRPDEPVTAGLPVGPGPGPEVLGPLAEQGNGVDDLAMYLPLLEFMASQPGASGQTRNFVRRLRGAAVRPL